MTAVAVIIPYFQEKPGILRRALNSVLQQRLPANVKINVIVVDDASPVPARAEIETLVFAEPFRLRVIEQPNGGVGAARNTGLRNAGDQADYIAFLDSDDIWEPEHLARALAALDSGFDFYFCDNRRIGQYDSQFATIGGGGFLSMANGRAAGDDLYEIGKDNFHRCALLSFAFQLSTVVYRRSVAPDLAFDGSLQFTGEDHLFLLQLGDKARRIGFSPAIRVTCADGVNIYYSKLSWDDPGHLIRYMGTILMHNEFLKKLSLSPEDRLYFARQLTSRRRDFAFLTMRYFVKKRELWPPTLVHMTHGDPQFRLWYPACVLYVILAFPLGLYKPAKE